MPPRVPKTRGAGTYTEKAFFGWIRSQLRRMTMKWKPRSDCLKAARRPYDGPDRRRKWEYQCAECGQWFPGKQVEVDHIIPAGSLQSFDDLPGFVSRLFCETEGLQVLCKETCHHLKKSG